MVGMCHSTGSSQRYYRLLVPLPLTVVFPTATLCLMVEHCPIGQRWQVMAHNPTAGTWVMVTPVYRTAEALDHAAFAAGFPVLAESVAEVVLKRLVREGRAGLA